MALKEVTRFVRGKLIPMNKLKWEADAMFRVTGHPGIVEIIDWLHEKGRSFVVTELCDGGDLFEKVGETNIRDVFT